jgi:hypothetical protein
MTAFYLLLFGLSMTSFMNTVMTNYNAMIVVASALFQF